MAQAAARGRKNKPIFEEGFTVDIELQLIEFFKETPLLYDTSDPRHKKRDLKDRLLTEKADELRALGLQPCDPERLLRWLRCQRASYNRVVAKKSGDGTKRLTAKDSWIHEKYSFLSQYSRNCQSRVTNVSIYMH
jgi:hypothetical protein